jgi:hypothetical protein
MLKGDQPSAVAIEPPARGQLRTSPRRRRPGAIAMLLGVVGGGLIGVLLGAYGLLWIMGPEGDVLGMEPWLPQALRPPAVDAPP